MEDISKLAKNMGSNLKDMLNMLDKNMAQLQDDNNPVIKNARIDVSNMLNALKNGDSTPVEEIIKKYGSNNR